MTSKMWFLHNRF